MARGVNAEIREHGLGAMSLLETAVQPHRGRRFLARAVLLGISAFGGGCRLTRPLGRSRSEIADAASLKLPIGGPLSPGELTFRCGLIAEARTVSTGAKVHYPFPGLDAPAEFGGIGAAGRGQVGSGRACGVSRDYVRMVPVEGHLVGLTGQGEPARHVVVVQVGLGYVGDPHRAAVSQVQHSVNVRCGSITTAGFRPG
jgi:hypothetical protein